MTCLKCDKKMTLSHTYKREIRIDGEIKTLVTKIYTCSCGHTTQVKTVQTV